MRPILNPVALAILTFSAGGIMSAGRAEEIKTYFAMDREPAEIPLPWTMYLHPGLVPLWKQALARPESELKRQAAEAIARAHTEGHKEVQSTVDELLKILTADKVHPATRHAAAHALIVLDCRKFGPQLFDVSQMGGKDLRLLIEPALADWNFEQIREIWRQRIKSVRTARADLLLAIDGLGKQRDTAALPDMLTLTMSAEHPADVRLAAARAAARIANEGLELQARELMARGQVLDRMCAVSFVTQHRSEQAIQIHLALGIDVEPAVAGEALRTLYAIDPKLILPIAEHALKNPDTNVRSVGIDTYLALPTIERIKILALKLNDPHPKLRGRVRDAFAELSNVKELDSTIRQSSIAILNGDDWRGQEQAALLLGTLDEESVAPRLIELLKSKRPEVMESTAWSLRMIEVPQTAAPVLDFAQRLTDSGNRFTRPVSNQIGHLFELLGRLKAVEAVPLLEHYVLKTDQYGIASRAAAVWALGVIYEGQVNEPLAKKLLERFLDVMSSPPEMFEVRRASILSLGRMRAVNQVEALKKALGPTVEQDFMEFTIRLAIQQITGELLPIEPPGRIMRTGWFLEPTLEPKNAETNGN